MSTTEIVIVLVASAIAALVKSTTGMGYPLVLLPVLALFIDVAEAVVIVAPSNLVLNSQLTWGMREHRSEARTLSSVLKWSVPGAVVGALLLPVLPDASLRIVLVVIIVVFLINRVRSPNTQLSESQSKRLAAPVGFFAGGFQGAAGISGPIVTSWFLSVGISRDAFIFSIATVFALSGFAQIVVLAIQGLFTPTLIALGAALIPLSFLIFPFGKKLRDMASPQMFERVVLGLLMCSAISLVLRLVGIL